MSYDVRVYELVEHFLSGVPEKNTERNRHLLAQHIQDELEDWTLFMLLPEHREDATVFETKRLSGGSKKARNGPSGRQTVALGAVGVMLDQA